ncbi:hypothetical protein [Pseudoalteromonas rubra]|uniref:hypothetical protein n=1 Tax=Pseudoalteromonas rubra TaxID=43658 RepID=UPI0013DE4A2C|nr:hypothetical protein [Pseudoalteromonas rubra]
MNKKKQFGPSLYFYHDKAIFDGLSQHSITKPELHHFLLKKGVIASQDTDKGELAYYLSSCLFDYHDRNRLSDLLTSKPKRENVTSSSLKKDENPKLEDETIRQAISNLRESLSKGPDCQASITCTKDSFLLDVTYKDHDLTKPEIKQVETKRAQIEILKEKDGYTVRSPANDYGDKLLMDFTSSLGNEIDADIEVQELSLAGITDSHGVSKFFTTLIHNIEGYKLYDVTNVKLYHPEVDEREEEEFTASHIRRAMLNGKQVLITPELKSLYDRGFHISSVQWLANDKSPEGDRVAFEASLKKPETKEGFSFQIRGIYRYSERTLDVTQKLTTPSNIEKKDIHKKLESAACLALEKIPN